MTEKEFLQRYDNKEEFTESELADLRDDLEEVGTSYGDNRRWLRTAITIFKIEGRYFALEWEEGLTEMQENQYYNQPYEVYPTEKVQTITVIAWNKKEEN